MDTGMSARCARPAPNAPARAVALTLQCKILTATHVDDGIVRWPFPSYSIVMLSLRDCLDHSNLSELEVGVLADHTGLPTMLAATLAGAMLQSEGGADLFLLILRDAETQAAQKLDTDKHQRARAAVEQFCRVHKQALRQA